MKYYSTRNKSISYNFKKTLMEGLSPDGGLFYPEELPIFKFENTLTFTEIAYEVSRKFIDMDISNYKLAELIDRAFYFNPDLQVLDNKLSILELFHGPTLAFKDFGARFMSEFMSYYSTAENNQTYILVATSGDTGSAVANAFYKKQGIEVFILYPSGMVSEIQEKQLTTYDENITALEIQGNFDDCQRLVKSMFLDNDVNHVKKLTSANSINISRLIPQSFYYIYLFQHLSDDSLVVVPSGNLGNLTAGIYASKMMKKNFKFLSALNSNNVFEEYLKTGEYNPRNTIKTLSNAMDVGNPSNLERLLSIFNSNFNEVNKLVKSVSISDSKTEKAITDCYDNYSYILDPHGAVGYAAIKQNSSLIENINSVVILETAHPAKFKEIVEKNIGRKLEIPSRLMENLNRPKRTVLLTNKSEDLKEFLLTR